MNPLQSYTLTTAGPLGPAPGPGPGGPATGPADPDREFDRTAPAGVSAGSLGYGSGGPVYLDAFHSKRPPTPPELVNAVKNVAFACIGLNAKSFARVPLRLYAKTGPGQKKPRRSWQPVPDRAQRYLRQSHPTLSRAIGTHDEVDEIVQHPLLDALEKPNEYFDKTLFLQFLCASLDSVGSAFMYPVRPPAADGLADPSWAASEIWPLQAQYVYPIKGTGERLVAGWQYFTDRFANRELVRVRNWSLRDPYLSAYSPLHASYEQNGLVDYYTASVEAVLKGGGRPDAVLTSKDQLMPIGPDEAERYEREINKRMAGPNQGKIWVMRGAFDLHTLNYKPVDLGGLQLSKEQRLLAANCFDVPIDMLESEGSNRATASESTHKHQYYAIAPRCCLADGALTNQLARPVDPRLFFAFDDPVSRDVELSAKVFDMKIKNRSATINEARADEGLAPVPWGDEPEGGLAPPAKPGPGQDPAADQDPETGPTATTGHQAGGDVQKQALNGAQISSMVEVVGQVAAGVIPHESAEAILAAAFPALTPDQVRRIVGPIDVKPPPPPDPPPAFGGGPDPGPPEPPDPEPDEPEPAERAALYGQLRTVLRSLETRLENVGPGGAGGPGGGGGPGDGGGRAADGGPAPDPGPGPDPDGPEPGPGPGPEPETA